MQIKHNIKNLLLLIFAIQLVECHLVETCPAIDNLAKGITLAKESNTKLFVVFDTYGSPTKYVDEILSDSDIIAALDKCVVVRLMCDARTKTNDSLSVGQFNANLQMDIFKENYQPMFSFLDKQGKKISPPLGYSNKEYVLQYINKYK